MTVAVENLDSRKYGRLLARVLPVVIQTEQEYDRIDAEIGRLLKKGHRDLSPEERALLELMTKLIEDYDAQNFAFPKSQPHEILRALMDQNELTQTDLLPIFKSRGYISEVLSGKRAISKRIAKALGARFSVSAELFI
ncbi:MAG: helix-turn-helix domain-containing protein [Blastocatellia bacterium]